VAARGRQCLHPIVGGSRRFQKSLFVPREFVALNHDGKTNHEKNTLKNEPLKNTEKNMTKTNAMRMLDAAKIKYEIKEYEVDEIDLSGRHIAEQIGLPMPQVFKTLVLQGASREYYVCVIPVAEELNLKKAAKHFGEKKIEMIPHREITNVTGYIKGGCSPVGMKKLFRTAIHSSASGFETIIVSAGKVGLQMEVPVAALLEIAQAQLAEIAG
jgi:Cys-tRNA(Pro)/Cys-tRNA(Cys) deacylase